MVTAPLDVDDPLPRLLDDEAHPLDDPVDERLPLDAMRETTDDRGHPLAIDVVDEALRLMEVLLKLIELMTPSMTTLGVKLVATSEISRGIHW
ncbi:hypothetical protein NCC49_004341 [Naganishia albida]|nr:hypothetical protein NCC49_004341 [Naganishia albida]